MQRDPLKNPTDKDLLVIWNRQGVHDVFAKRYEARGATVLVAENGYIGVDKYNHHLFALSLNHHNGAGWYPAPIYDRLTRLNLDIKPWRETGDKVLVLPQRGVGEKGVAMPFTWLHDIQQTLRRATHRRVQVRAHPGRAKSEPYADFTHAWCAVTWGSTAAIKAIVAGVPVFYTFPRWIAARAASDKLAQVEHPFTGDRVPMLCGVAWAQWAADEIQTGYALDYYIKRQVQPVQLQ